MGHHIHLTPREREDIMLMRRDGKGVSEIARSIKRDKSTVSRELKRNSCGRFYRASTAQRRYEERRLSCRRRRILDDERVFGLVRDKFLGEQWSPEQIEGRLALELGESPVSDTTIYRGIDAGLFDGCVGGRKARRRLRHRGKRRKGPSERRGKIKVSHEISERPAAAEGRGEPGHGEGDTVAGKAGGACLLTLVDRKDGFLVGGKCRRKTAKCVRDKMPRALEGQPLASVTLDRGKEFADHAQVTGDIGVEFYFALPHHPWQRGTNENTNGLLREYFPKGESLGRVSENRVQEVYDKLNRRPRKRLGYRTPYEIHYSETLHLI